MFIITHPSTLPSSSSPGSANLTCRSRGPGLLIAVVFIAPVAVNGCSTSSDQAVPAQSPAPSASAGVDGSQDVHFTVDYAGDILMCMPVVGSTPAGSGDITANIATGIPWVGGLDLTPCGIEAPVAPDGVYLGYPASGTSTEVVAALARSGWDGCAIVSNHAADRGGAGVVATSDALDARGLGHVSTYRSQQDTSVPFAPYELERGGHTMTVAQIFTIMDLNGLEDPTGYPMSLNDISVITKAAKSARATGADLVIVHSQLSEEYGTMPNDKQASYAQSLADTGRVDIFFSAHPHVPQPAEKLSGGVGGKGIWMSYLADSYISNQDEDCCAPLSDVGQLARVDITSHADGLVSTDKLN